MRRILLVTDGFFHPPYYARRVLHKILAELDGFSFSYVSSMEDLPVDLETYQAIVLYVHHKRISKSALERLDAFVNFGGGLLGIHSATASYKDSPHFFKILGGRFIGHGPVEKFVILPMGRTDVFSGIPQFEVMDELYLHELQPDIDVHFISVHDGEKVPVVWTRKFGEGQVCYAVLGHRVETMKNEVYQELLQQALNWVAG